MHFFQYVYTLFLYTKFNTLSNEKDSFFKDYYIDNKNFVLFGRNDQQYLNIMEPFKTTGEQWDLF